MIQLGTKIQSQVQSEIDKGQREYYLREQLKAIQQELGEGDEQQAEINELRERIERGQPPRGGPQAGGPGARPAGAPAPGGRRVRRHPHLPRVAGRAAVGQATTEDDLDIAHAREVLDADHYDLEKVKDRILEYLAVRNAANKARHLLRFASGGVAVGKGADPLLRRAPGSGKDEPGPVDREGARARVRADLGRRRPRRGGDPRPPAHLHRGDARRRSSARCATPAPATPCS